MSLKPLSFKFESRAEQAIARCRRLAAISDVEGETTRLFLSPSVPQVHALVADWMRDAGMSVHVDAAGNIRGLAGDVDAPRLVLGSHLDTVPNAGAFDGILGVMLGIAVAEAFEPRELAIEVIGFSEEEGVRFRKPFLGSMALVGQLEEHLELADASGVTLADALRGFGLKPERLNEARISPRAVGYLEFHIEQGPVLESLGLPLGVVTALVGQTRMEFSFRGQANHAGTTPMHLRRDALAAAAEWVVAAETLARETSGLVATVGKIEAMPGAGNVIPGRVTASLDVRHADDSVRRTAVVALIQAANEAGNLRGVVVENKVLMEQGAVALDAGLTALLASAAGERATALPSGAGHDAMILAPHVPSAMLFVRSPGGLSHHPEESVIAEDVTAALAAGVDFVRALSAAVLR